MSPKLELYVSYIYDKIKLCNKAALLHYSYFQIHLANINQ